MGTLDARYTPFSDRLILQKLFYERGFVFIFSHTIAVPHDNQLFDILLRVEHQVHLGFLCADARVLSRV